MAELQQTAIAHTRRRTTGKKLSTRIDLTPMVDLGFLLITFFIFTTTLSEQKAMNLNLPQSDDDSMQTEADKTISLLLCKDNVVQYYTGDNPAFMKVTNYSPAGIRSIIQQQQQRIAKQFGDAQQAVILIKPTAASTYENVVNTLDEMVINDIKRYILMDANNTEINFLK